MLKRNVDDDPNDTESRVSLTYSEVYQLQPDLFTNEDNPPVIIAFSTATGEGMDELETAVKKKFRLEEIGGTSKRGKTYIKVMRYV